jgi:hypothetical protein
MRNRRVLIAIAIVVASLLILGIGYYTRIIFPLPNSYRPAHGDALIPSGDVKLEATRCVISWIVEGSPIPGYKEEYPDAKIMKGQKRFVVVCSFVAEDAVLSTDSRVYRVDADHVTRVRRKYGYEDTDYISLSWVKESEHSFYINLSNFFGSLGGHFYSFHFRETEDGLVAEGKCEGTI